MIEILHIKHIINAINCLSKAFYSVIYLGIQINNKEILVSLLYT